MPELPEVETIVRQLEPVVSGKTIAGVTVAWPRTVGGDQAGFVRSLTGKKLSRVHRRGKYLCFDIADEGCLTIHLRMTGKLLFQPDETDSKYIRTVFEFTDRSSLYFVDVRKFGRMKLWSKDSPLLPQLGPEPLEEKNVFQALANHKSTRAIKTLLLDQEVLAGVGNIYADEVLFTAGIHPLTPANTLKKKQVEKLGLYLPEILKQAIKNNGTTISDYRTAEAEEGGNQFFLNVYGRTGEPCTRCQTPISRIRINNRGSHYCPRCQRKPALSIAK